MKITFLGAAQTVTGSKYLINFSKKNILIDCGLFQGKKDLRLRNWAKFPFDPAAIDAVILTHAHIDHTGYIPLLVKNGFTGPIYCTYPTADLCKILLPDSGYLQEEEAVYANKHQTSKHHPALPLYTMADAVTSLKQLKGCAFGKVYKLCDGFTFEFNRAGHILGAAMVKIKYQDISLLFTGDLGRLHDPVMKSPVTIRSTDYLVLESTYGNRHHEVEDPTQALRGIINRTIKRGGALIIPAFAVGRVQTLLYLIYQLKIKKQITDIPVFVDSPMATNATALFCRYSSEHILSVEKCRQVYGAVHYVHTVEESKQLNEERIPKIIISSSGMATGGRVLHHIRAFADDCRNTLLFTGFQASGTRGDRLVRGEREIRIFGETISVNAEVVQLNNLSAHADQGEILAWLKGFQSPPRKVFITHGELEAALALKESIESIFSWQCIVPSYLQEEILI
jgi:metallo-beta-lactamase family protein